MGEDQRAALIDNTARNMDGVTENIRLRHAAHCYKADPEYGDRLAAALVVDVERVHELAAMTHEERMAATGQQVPARKIGGEVRAYSIAEGTALSTAEAGSDSRAVALLDESNAYVLAMSEIRRLELAAAE